MTDRPLRTRHARGLPWRGAVAFAVAQALLLAWLSLWLVQRPADQSPGLHGDSVLFVPAASRCAEGACGEFAVYLRLFLAREPPSWALDLHGQAYPATLAALAQSPDYAELIEATRVLSIAVGWLAWLACWVRAREGWAYALLALPLALATGLVSLAHAGRPEQLVPLVCAVAWLLRAIPRLRRSAAGFGVEVGAIACVSPAPAVVAGALYLWLLLAGTPAAQAPGRVLRLALAAAGTWFVALLCFAPHPPWTVLAQTLAGFAGARGAGPTGLSEAFRMLWIHPDVPGVGAGWALFAAIALAASLRARRAVGASTPLALGALGLLGALVVALALQVYTQQYNVASVSLALLSAFGALPRASLPAPRRLVWLLPAALSLPALALWTAPVADRAVHGAAERAALASVLPTLVPDADARILTLEADAALWLAEPRPGRFLVAQDADPAALARLDAALGTPVCWVLSAHAPVADDRVVAWRLAGLPAGDLVLQRRTACDAPAPPRGAHASRYDPPRHHASGASP